MLMYPGKRREQHIGIWWESRIGLDVASFPAFQRRWRHPRPRGWPSSTFESPQVTLTCLPQPLQGTSVTIPLGFQPQEMVEWISVWSLVGCDAMRMFWRFADGRGGVEGREPSEARFHATSFAGWDVGSVVEAAAFQRDPARLPGRRRRPETRLHPPLLIHRFHRDAFLMLHLFQCRKIRYWVAKRPRIDESCILGDVVKHEF